MENLNILGLKVSNFNEEELNQIFDSSLTTDKTNIFFGYSLGYLPLFKKYPDLYPIVNSFDLLVPDGTQFKWFCSLFGYKLKSGISIPDLTNYAMSYANKNRLKVLLFGAKEHINLLANRNLEKAYPNMVLLKGISGYFTEDNEENILKTINDLSPDILLIGISTPLKEKFTYNYRNYLKTRIIIPCGGMIDVFAGKTRQTPHIIKKLGFATPYRVIQEPRRLLMLNLWMIYEILFKLLPIAFYYNYFRKRKSFDLIKRYLK